MFERIKSWAKQQKRKLLILYFAYKDGRTPWYAKVIAVCVVAYAFSPIDLIPDFIPILGYLDDVVLVPLGVWVAMKLVPQSVIQTCTVKADQRTRNVKPKNILVGGLIIVVWIVAFIWISVAAYRYLVK